MTTEENNRQQLKPCSPSDHLSSSAHSDGVASVSHHISQGNILPQYPRWGWGESRADREGGEGEDGGDGGDGGTVGEGNKLRFSKLRSNQSTGSLSMFMPHFALCMVCICMCI